MSRLRYKLYAIAFALCYFLGFCALAWAQFETRTTVPVGREPNSIAVGDFDHDGNLDIAVAQANTYRIGVLLGNGDGTFKPPVNYAAGTAPLSIASADLNHDGNLDLVVASLESSISVLLGNGDGTFQSTRNYSTNAQTLRVQIADLNGDKNPDLVILDSPFVSVMLGNGDGTFQSVTDFSMPYTPFALGIGDFDGDGKTDLAVGGQGLGSTEVEILLGNGDGTFRQGADYPVVFTPESISVSEFNRDGTPDMAVASEFGFVTIFLGNGDGTFDQSDIYQTPSFSSTWVAVADFNRDGNTDLAVADAGPSAGVSVFLGNGDGTFKPETLYPAGAEAFFLAIGDFNGDRLPDLVVTDYLHNKIVSLLNTGAASFSPSTPISFPPQIIGTASAAQFVTLTNSGSMALSIPAMSVEGPFRLRTTCGVSLSPGSKCLIGAAFVPLSIGNHKGTITIVDSASSKPQVIALSGEGTVVNLLPSRLEFPPQKVGTKSAAHLVTITNKGNFSLAVHSITTGGYDLFEFSETDDCTGQELAPDASCSIWVVFTPKGVGVRTATLIVNDNGGGVQTVALQGNGATYNKAARLVQPTRCQPQALTGEWNGYRNSPNRYCRNQMG